MYLTVYFVVCFYHLFVSVLIALCCALCCVLCCFIICCLSQLFFICFFYICFFNLFCLSLLVLALKKEIYIFLLYVEYMFLFCFFCVFSDFWGGSSFCWGFCPYMLVLAGFVKKIYSLCNMFDNLVLSVCDVFGVMLAGLFWCGQIFYFFC